MNRIFNFGAGPAMLPTAVMEKAQQEFLNYKNMGASVIEISPVSYTHLTLPTILLV